MYGYALRVMSSAVHVYDIVPTSAVHARWSTPGGDIKASISSFIAGAAQSEPFVRQICAEMADDCELPSKVATSRASVARPPIGV